VGTERIADDIAWALDDGSGVFFVFRRSEAVPPAPIRTRAKAVERVRADRGDV
jgi:hypothetical protein